MALLFFPGFLNGELDTEALHAGMVATGKVKSIDAGGQITVSLDVINLYSHLGGRLSASDAEE